MPCARRWIPLQQMVEIGEYAGMKMKVTFDSFNRKFVMSLKGELSHNFELGSDAFGNITRLHNVLDGMAGKLSEAETKLNNVTHQLETAKMEVQKAVSCGGRTEGEDGTVSGTGCPVKYG